MTVIKLVSGIIGFLNHNPLVTREIANCNAACEYNNRFAPRPGLKRPTAA